MSKQRKRKECGMLAQMSNYKPFCAKISRQMQTAISVVLGPHPRALVLLQ